MKIAVVIPLYNGIRFIGEALESIQSQTLAPAEIIVVDDGSTDGGAEKVKAFDSHIPISLLAKPNGGQSSARNYAIARTDCELVAFLDQDDIWYPNHLEDLFQYFVGNDNLGWAYSDIDEIDESGKLLFRRVHLRTRSVHPKANYQECLSANMEILPTATLARRAAIEKVGAFDDRLSGYEDDDLFLRILLAGYSHAYIAAATCQWRKHDSASVSPRMAISRRVFADKLFASFPNDSKPIVERFLGPVRRALYQALRTRDASAATALFAEARSLIGRLPALSRMGPYASLLFRILRGYLNRVSAN